MPCCAPGFVNPGFVNRGLRPAAARFCAALLLLIPSFARAQLDLGTGDVPQGRIDGYIRPFCRVLAEGLAQGRFGPGRDGTGAEAGFQAGLLPLPDRDPFRATSLRALPLLRLRAGGHWAGAGVEARGLIWKDPRLGDLAAWGVGARYGLPLPPAAWPLRLDVEAGWDGMDFSSAYTYRYRGSFLGLADQDVPGDYRLAEQVVGGAVAVSFRRGNWTPYLKGGFDRAFGRFAYLYLDPRDGNTRRLRSHARFAAGHAALGLAWRGFRAEASAGTYLALDLGWSFFRARP